MPSRTQGDLHIDAALTAMSLRYSNKNYVAEKLLPRVQVQKESDKYFVYGKDNLRVPNTTRANGALAQQVSQSLSQDSYSITEHSLRELVTDRDLENADEALAPLEDAMRNTLDRIWLGLDKDVATRLRDVAVLTQTVTLIGAQQWSDFANSDPLADIETGINTIQANAVQRPNTIMIPQSVWTKLKQHPDIIDRIKHTTLGVMTPQLLAQLLELQTVLIGDAIENTANEGAADALSFIWGKDVIIAHVQAEPGLRKQSLGYLFTKRQPRTVKRYREEARGGEWVEPSDFYDHKVISAVDGYLIKSAVA